MEETVKIQKTEVAAVGTCQNTAIVVGEFAAELRPYIYPRNIFTSFS